MLPNWKKWNWRAGLLPFVAACYLTYQEVRDDHDANPSTVMNGELVFGVWTAALGILLGTTTNGQTKTIAQDEAKKEVDKAS
jgi:hypothetical protein